MSNVNVSVAALVGILVVASYGADLASPAHAGRWQTAAIQPCDDILSGIPCSQHQNRALAPHSPKLLHDPESIEPPERPSEPVQVDPDAGLVARS
jgi:hypothetical protein